VSVSFARAVADGLRRHGVVVHFHPGWEWRGNGQTSAYAGGVMHHTGAAFDGGFDVLVNGRADLPGPLCNSNGWADGSITIIAAHPANHAGAAGGSWARPFPDTRNFNRMVWGHEIMFPGTVPMTRAQYRSALILGGVISGILGRPNPEWIRLHYETSVTGKWDFGAGRGHGVWFPGATYRRDIWPALNDGAPSPSPEDDMPTPQELWDHLLIDRWSGNEMRAGQLLGWIGQHVVASRRTSEANQAAITAMAKLLGQQQGLDAAEIEAAVRRAIEDSLVQVDVTVSDRTEGGAPLA
jgi:hypothetical protein